MEATGGASRDDGGAYAFSKVETGTSMPARSVLWFRRDLRLDDHPALTRVCRESESFLPVWIDDPEDSARYGEGRASRWWLRRSVESLAKLLRAHGQELVVLHGDTRSCLEALVRAEAVTDVYAHRRHEPRAIADEEALGDTFAKSGIRLHLFHDAYLHDPARLLTATGHPFRIFTPFWRRLEQDLSALPAAFDPPALPPPWTTRGAISTRAETGFGEREPTWTRKFETLWTPGTVATLVRARSFFEQRARHYKLERDRLDRAATSGLAAPLHFGEISARRLEFLARDHCRAHPDEQAGIDAFRRQLGWREFARHLLVHDPALVSEPFDRRYRDFPWSDDAERLAAWKEGRLGSPLLDAAMRELWNTGTVHNRARMNVAGFLTRMLNVHWRHGLSWFAETLLDADLANNLFGWQWASGCGADAAPFVRLFNPALQAQRFDPEGHYIARHLHSPDPQESDPPPPADGRKAPLRIPDRAALRREALLRYERWRSRSTVDDTP